MNILEDRDLTELLFDRCIIMPVESAEPQAASSVSRPVSAALTPGVSEEDGATWGSAICTFPENTQSSEAAAAYPANTGPGESNNGELINTRWR